MLFNLHLVQIGDFAFDHLDRRGLFDALDVQCHRQITFQNQEVLEQFIREFRRQDLQIGDLSLFATHAKTAGGSEIKTTGSDKVLGCQTALFEAFPVEVKFVLALIQQIMHHVQAFSAIQGLSDGTQPSQMAEYIQFNPFQTCFGSAVIIRFDAKDQIFVFDQTVVSFRQLVA